MLVTINRCVAQKAALAPSAVVARMLNTFSQQEAAPTPKHGEKVSADHQPKFHPDSKSVGSSTPPRWTAADEFKKQVHAIHEMREQELKKQEQAKKDKIHHHAWE